MSIVEAVFENLDVKREVFRKLDDIAKPGRDSRFEHIHARHRRAALQRRSDPIGSRACTSSFRPTSCRCSRSFAARRRRRRRSQPPSRSARALAQEGRALGECIRVHRKPDDLRLRARGNALAEEGVTPARDRRRDETLRLPDGAFCDERSLRARHRVGDPKSARRAKRSDARTCWSGSSR